MIDWLTLNANFSNISWREQILYHKLINYKTLRNKTLVYKLVEQELFTVPEHLGSPLVFSGVRVTRSLVSCVYFVDRCLSFCTFSFGHCIVCSLNLILKAILYGIQSAKQNIKE
jgi:hypothetical protein